jgi:hypothetical protein
MSAALVKYSPASTHDIKIADSCLIQARAFDDPTYLSVAAAYLAPRLAASAQC